MTRTRDEILTAFGEQVNMSADALEEWLQTAESQQAGQVKEGADESVGHQSGRRIVEILRKQRNGEELTDEDVDHCGKVTAYIARHSAQRPHKADQDLEHMKWTSSLRNWGHDPLAPSVARGQADRDAGPRVHSPPQQE